MKLSPYMNDIERAYAAIMLAIHTSTHRDEYAFSYQRRRPAHVLPREHAYSRPPRLPQQFEPEVVNTPFYNKEKLVLLAAFQATY